MGQITIRFVQAASSMLGVYAILRRESDNYRYNTATKQFDDPTTPRSADHIIELKEFGENTCEYTKMLADFPDISVNLLARVEKIETGFNGVLLGFQPMCIYKGQLLPEIMGMPVPGTKRDNCAADMVLGELLASLLNVAMGHQVINKATHTLTLYTANREDLQTELTRFEVKDDPSIAARYILPPKP